MPPRSLLLAAATVAALVTVPATALAIPPANDNYLASTAINEAGAAVPPEYQDTVDTTEATTQADLFNPSRTGQPLGGDDPENTQCRATSFGRTVWYDFHTPTPGGIELNTSGFDAVITVYQWNDANAKIVRTVNCQDTAGPTERFDVFRLKRNKAYTIQVGGVSGPA